MWIDDEFSDPLYGVTNTDTPHANVHPAPGSTITRILPQQAQTQRSLFHITREFASRKMRRLLLPCLSILGYAIGHAATPSTAFFYGYPVPVAALAQYERVVVEAENLQDPGSLRTFGSDVFAYLSVGEAEGWRKTAQLLPPELFLGANVAWNSRVADLTHSGWQSYLLEERMGRLWKMGYRGFFLDTLDSYQIAVKNPEEQRAQLTAQVKLIRAMHQRYPGVKLLFNRGFDILPEVASLAAGLVAESLFQSWNPTTQEYVSVGENDRSWLLVRLQEAHLRYGLPITVIDYVPANKPELARETARRIKALGFTSWVANPGLDMLAVGADE